MLILYQFEECPYCVKVRRKMTELGLDYVAVNAPHHLPERRKFVEQLGGKNQVPLLIDTDKNVLLYESDEIVAFLEEQYTK